MSAETRKQDTASPYLNNRAAKLSLTDPAGPLAIPGAMPKLWRESALVSGFPRPGPDVDPKRAPSSVGARSPDQVDETNRGVVDSIESLVSPWLENRISKPKITEQSRFLGFLTGFMHLTAICPLSLTDVRESG